MLEALAREDCQRGPSCARASIGAQKTQWKLGGLDRDEMVRKEAERLGLEPAQLAHRQLRAMGVRGLRKLGARMGGRW